jgi:hypothetical protein
MSPREELHHLLDQVPEAQMASVREFLRGLAVLDWDAYLSSVPNRDEALTTEERGSLLGDSPSAGRVSLSDLQREIAEQ